MKGQTAIGPAPAQLVNGAEIGRRLNVSRERVRQWAANPNLSFPAPAGRRGRSRTWDWALVEAWAERHNTTRSVIAYAERRRAYDDGQGVRRSVPRGA